MQYPGNVVTCIDLSPTYRVAPNSELMMHHPDVRFDPHPRACTQVFEYEKRDKCNGWRPPKPALPTTSSRLNGAHYLRITPSNNQSALLRPVTPHYLTASYAPAGR